MNLKQVKNNHRSRYKRSPTIRETLKRIVEITERCYSDPKVIARNRPIKSTMELVQEKLM